MYVYVKSCRAKVKEMDRKIKELKSLRSTLRSLADHYHGDNRPDCPILEEMAKGGPS